MAAEDLVIAAIAVAVYLAACSVAVWTVPPRGVTWLGLLNFAILQWLGVRLQRVCEPLRDDVDLDDPAAQGFTTRMLRERQVGWKWAGGIVPITGWWSSYRYFGGRR